MTFPRKAQTAVFLSVLLFLMAFWPYLVLADDLTGSSGALVAEAPFSDVSPDHACAAALQQLKAAGIVTGYPNGTFQPDHKITRQEFSFLLSRAFGSDSKYTSSLLRSHDQNFISYADGLKLLLLELGVSRRIATESLPDIPKVDKRAFSGRAGEGFLYAAYYFGLLSPDQADTIDYRAFLSRGDAVLLLANARAVKAVSFTLPKTLYAIPVSFNGDQTGSFVNDVASGLSCFPDTILQAYASLNGAITVTDADPSTYYRVKTEVNGMYWPNSNAIILFTHGGSSSLLYSLEGTVRHEMGHFLYDEMVSASDCATLKRLFESDEAVRFIQATGRSCARENVSEYFAELVSYMTLYGWDTACDAFPKSAAITAHYLELKPPAQAAPEA